MMVEKRLYYDPTIVRYTEPNMDDTRREEHRRQKYRIIPIFSKAGAMAASDPGAQGHGGKRRRRLDVPARDAGARFRSAGEDCTSDARPCHPERNRRSTRKRWAGMTASDPSTRASMPTWSPSRRRPARRHHRAAAGEVRDERRQGCAERSLEQVQAGSVDLGPAGGSEDPPYTWGAYFLGRKPTARAKALDKLTHGEVIE